MTTYIAYGNINQPFSLESLPDKLIPENLYQIETDSSRVFQRHQCRRLAHLLLFQLLKISGKSTALLSQIQRTESGRPYFLDERIDFNISHSGDWVAVILDIRNEEKSAVGIDIEFPKIRNFMALMEHIAPKEEIDWFHHQQDSLKAFYRCWCLREAVLKSQGFGIVKLSNVCHFPEQQKIFSDYCPQGKLWFTDELPVYLAAFVNHQEKLPHFYEWSGEQLQLKILQEFSFYHVN